MDIEDTDYAPEANSSDNESSRSRETAPRKRHRRRRAAGQPYDPPLKRRKGNLHPKYATLLNGEIADASAGITKDPGDPPLRPHSQVGAVVWTAAEQRAYFSAVGRLGRGDSAGIASRIGGTKSALEVRQYTVLLEAAGRVRRGDADRVLRAPRAVDIPAATELGTELCLALEAAADDLSVRLEAREEQLEQQRWAGRWLITPGIALVLEHQLRQPEHRQEILAHMPFAGLFRLGSWPRLSARVFMNSSVVPDGNWRCVSEEPPAVRATALADFYSLALSVTRRLVAASLFVAQSRIRARQAGGDNPRRGPRRVVVAAVRAKDVQAALASVGMRESSSREFWARAPRRLRLDVYKEEEAGGGSSDGGSENGEEGKEGTDINDPGLDLDSDENEEEEEDAMDQDNEIDTTYQYEPDIMSYDEVEAALGFPNPHIRPPTPSYRILPDVSSTSSESGGEDSDQNLTQPEAVVAENSDSDVSMKGEEDGNSDADLDSAIDPNLVAQDLAEATQHSSLYHADTARAREAIARSIRAELQLEAEADRFDSRASAREEARLWAMLRRGEDYSDVEKGRKRPPKVSGNSTYRAGLEVEADGEDGHWRDYTEYYADWEFDRAAGT
ncbi:Electron transfer flavoprotein alpha-subunit [Hypoxylon texense]